jgi:hypothetical protein
MFKPGRGIGRSILSVLVPLLAIALCEAFGTTLLVSAATQASQGPGYSQGSPTITCIPNDPDINSGCQVEFLDVALTDGNTGVVVCFSTTGTNTVTGKSGNCSAENASGEAFGTFNANQCGSATLKGTVEDDVRTATTTVDVICAVTTPTPSAVAPATPTATPSPTAVASATPTPSATAVVSATPTPSPTGGVLATATASPTGAALGVTTPSTGAGPGAGATAGIVLILLGVLIGLGVVVVRRRSVEPL